jgi:hypothetical protein
MMLDGWISREAPIAWPPNSPELTPPVYFFFGVEGRYVKYMFFYPVENSDLKQTKACIRHSVPTVMYGIS